MTPLVTLPEKYKKLIIKLLTLVVFIIILVYIIFNLSNEIDSGNIGRIASVLGFVNGFITLVIAQLLKRNIYVRWGSLCIASMLLLWFGIVFCLLELISPANYILGDIEIKNLFLKSGMLIWLGGLSLLLFLISRVLSIDIITLKKSFVKKDKPYFEPFQNLDKNNNFIDEFGVSCIDTVFNIAHEEKRRIRFPILLISDKVIHPWKLTGKFISIGLDKEDGVILFTFSRPADFFYNKLKGDYKGREFLLENLIIIDCFSPLTDKQKAKTDFKVFHANPRNPYELNIIYNKSIKLLKKKKNRKKLRVVYDTLTDFLFYTHMELAAPYLKHNIIWEEENNASSIYLLCPDIAEKPINDNYLKWFMNTSIIMKRGTNYMTMEIEDIFAPRVEIYKLNNDFTIISE